MPLIVNKKLLLIGMIALIAGTLEYLLNRQVGSTHFLLRYESLHAFFYELPNFYGELGLYVPTFFHPLAFSLMSAAFVAGKKSKVMLCIAWLGIDLLFEIGQTFGPELVDYLPQSFTTVPIIRDFVDFLMYGTFDIYDLVSISLGSLTALLIVLYSTRKESDYE